MNRIEALQAMNEVVEKLLWTERASRSLALAREVQAYILTAGVR